MPGISAPPPGRSGRERRHAAAELRWLSCRLGQATLQITEFIRVDGER